MSDLIDRYVAAVAANLPKRDRTEVPAELRDVLLSKVEAREAELDRPLTKAEVEELLRQFGHPLEVAGRYSRNGYLIGPAVYPFYIFFLKVVLGIIAAIYVALYGMFVVAGGHGPGPQTDIFQALLIAFAATTLWFVVIDRTGVIGRISKSWKPGQLPLMGSPSGRKPFEVLFELAVVILAALWWVGVIQIPEPESGRLTLARAPIWQELYWPILALMVSQAGLAIFELVMPGLTRAHAIARIVLHVAFIGLMAVVYQAGHWVDVTVTMNKPGLQARLQGGFDNGFKIGLAMAFLVAAFEIYCAARRLIRLRRMMQARMA